MPPPLDANPESASPEIARRADSESVGARFRRDLGCADDHLLMELIGAGDRVAFAVFCRRHGLRCLQIAMHVLKNPHDAEEVVQDMFMRVWQHAGRFRASEARVTTWLFRVVVNLALDHLRKAAHFSLPLEFADGIATPDPDPGMLAEQREMARILHRAMFALPPRQRAALNLVVGEGLDCAEAAKLMHVTVGTMESLLVRGRRRLRLAMADAIAVPADRLGPTQARAALAPPRKSSIARPLIELSRLRA